MKHPNKSASQMSQEELASYIDYSVLKPEFTPEEIIALTKDGVKLGCATICINPGYIALCEPYVKGSKTMLCPVVDFPFGTSSTLSRLQQIEQASQSDQVQEVDIVANFGKIRSHLYEEVLDDLTACANTAHKAGKELKVILETDALNEDEILKMVEICKQANVDFVKTSTGFLTGHESHGATRSLIAKMLEAAQDDIKVKGSGCIRDRQHFLDLIDLGIDRMGIGYRSVPVVLALED